MKFFAWLAIQNRVWTADRSNCGLCPLCKQAMETVYHIFCKCRYPIKLWGMIKGWLKLDYLDISSWITMHSMKDWWHNMSATNMPN